MLRDRNCTEGFRRVLWIVSTPRKPVDEVAGCLGENMLKLFAGHILEDPNLLEYRPDEAFLVELNWSPSKRGVLHPNGRNTVRSRIDDSQRWELQKSEESPNW